jgi:hypothetical protein
VRGLPPSKASVGAHHGGGDATATTPTGSSPPTTSTSTFGTMTFRNYFNTLAGGGSSNGVDYTTAEYAFGTKAFNLVQNRSTDNQTLLQGWLRKRRKGSKAPWRRRWIVLTNESLYFYRVPDAKCSDIKVRQLRFAQLKRNIVDSASLVHARRRRRLGGDAGDDETRLQFEVVFGVSGEDSGATFIFECANESEYEQWTAAITGRCEALILEAIDATPKSSSAQRLASARRRAGQRTVRRLRRAAGRVGVGEARRDAVHQLQRRAPRARRAGEHCALVDARRLADGAAERVCERLAAIAPSTRCSSRRCRPSWRRRATLRLATLLRARATLPSAKRLRGASTKSLSLSPTRSRPSGLR